MSHRDRHSWIGIILVAIGGLMVLGNFRLFSFSVNHLIFSWRTISLVIGIIILSNSKNSVAGIIFLLIGIWGYLTYLFPWTFRFTFGDLWPIIFIIVGLSLLFRKRSYSYNRRQNNYQTYSKDSSEYTSQYSAFDEKGSSFSGDVIDEVSIFNSVKKYIHTQNFRGGKATSIFGGIQLDFSNSNLAPGENNLEISCIFGGCEIFVPKSWNVIVNVTSVFGGIDDKRFMVFEAPTSEGVLVIKGAVIFGGCEIHSV